MIEAELVVDVLNILPPGTKVILTFSQDTPPGWVRLVLRAISLGSLSVSPDVYGPLMDTMFRYITDENWDKVPDSANLRSIETKTTKTKCTFEDLMVPAEWGLESLTIVA